MAILPAISDLTAVRRSNGYVVGQLADKHHNFKYLERDALCMFASSVGGVFKAIDDLKWEPKHHKSSNDSDRGEFQTFKSLDEAINTFKNNPRSIRNFKEADEMLLAEDDIGRDVAYGVTGDYIDIGKFLEGDPECFGSAVNGNPSSLRVNIVVNANAVSYVTAEALNHKQSKILEIVDWFEARSVRCRILAYASTQCSHVEIEVKSFEDVVDMNDLAITGHGDFLRRIVFLIDEKSNTWQSGYGSPRYFTEAMNNHFKPDPYDGLTIYVDDQSSSDLDYISKQFENVKTKVADVISTPSKRDFSKVYMVQL